MHLNKIDLNLFVVFDTIFTERNLTRAGEILHITQPSVSNALARLRKEFDDQLFVRSGKGMIPTPVARNLIGPVRQALKILQTSVEDRSKFAPQTSDKLFVLSAGDIVGSILLPELMDRITRIAPNVRIQCYQVRRTDIVSDMAAGRLDFAIDIPALANTKLAHISVLEDRYVCVLRKNHPLARQSLTLNQYLDLGHVTVSSRRSGQSYVDIALNRLGKRARNTLRVQYYQAAFHTVQNSNLVLAAPESLARRYDAEISELPFTVPPLESLLFWHKNADHDPANIWMRQMIIETCRDIRRTD